MPNATSADSASLEARALRYKTLAVAFSYPEGPFFDCFGGVLAEDEKQGLPEEYDRLFRAQGIWLFGAEHTSANEFEKARALADIMGFYRAAGVEPEATRADALPCELEFMHYVIFKELRAAQRRGGRRKARLCLEMQRKFLADHLLPAARAIARAVLGQTESAFYRQAAAELLDFLASEEDRLLGVRT